MDWKKRWGVSVTFGGGRGPPALEESMSLSALLSKKSKTIDKKDKPAKSNRSIDQSQN